MLLPAVDRNFDDVCCINIYIDRHLREKAIMKYIFLALVKYVVLKR